VIFRVYTQFTKGLRTAVWRPMFFSITEGTMRILNNCDDIHKECLAKQVGIFIIIFYIIISFNYISLRAGSTALWPTKMASKVPG